MEQYKKDIISQNKEFQDIIYPLITNDTVQQMKNFKQHYETTCFEHCYTAAYHCYCICKKLNLDYKSATRAAMLHFYMIGEKDNLIEKDYMLLLMEKQLVKTHLNCLI